MSDLLKQLDNDEAILLMYLAGELPEPDRVEVEQRLINEPALRDALERLTALEAHVNAALAGMDAARAEVAAPRRASAVRRVVRAMTAVQAAAAPAEAAEAADPRRRLRIAFWAYPVAIAACLLVGMLIMANRSPRALEPTPEVRNIQLADATAPAPRIFDAADDPALERLDDVEKQVLSLHNPDVGLFEVDTADTER
jgi:anti-sigma factor RsiW